MKKRFLSFLLAGTILAFSLWGCGNASQEASAPDASVKASDAEGELSVYAVASDAKVDRYIEEFNLIYKNVKVEKRTFETQEEMDEKVKTELSAGKGPDVIIFDSATSLDVIKMAKNGAFQPLDEKMAVNNNLKAEDYLPGALDAGKVNGKQYILPLTFTIPTVLYNADEETGLEAASMISFEEWKSALEHNLERYRDDSERCASVGGPLFDFVLISSGALPLYDLEGSVELDPEKIENAVEICKIWYEDTSKVQRIVQTYDSQGADHFALFSTLNPDIFNTVWGQQAYQQHVNHEDFAIAGVKPSEAEGLTARVSSYGVIPKNAGDFAYEFLRCAMDTPAVTNLTATYGMSLSKNVSDYMLQHYTEAMNTKNTSDGAVIYLSGYTAEVSENLSQLLAGITDVKLYNQRVITIFKESFTPYLEGNKEYEDCYQEFQNKLNLYLTE